MTRVIKDFDDSRDSASGPGVLLPYQQAWVADESPVKVIEKSRRIGISWAEASDAALYSASKSGDDTWYIGYNQDMAKEFIDDVAFWAKGFQLAADEVGQIVIEDERKDILAFRVKFASGNQVTGLSSRPTNLRGKQGRVIIDEAAFHEDLPGLIKAAIALLIWGGQVRIISTHFGETNDFNSLVQDIRAGRKNYSLHRIDFDEALSDGLYQRICQVLGRKWSPAAEKTWRDEVIDFYGDDADEELFCVPSQGSGIFLSRALIETCMRPDFPVIRWGQPSEFTLKPKEERESVTNAFCEEKLESLLSDLDPKRRSVFGMDFGRSGDLSVFIPLSERQDASLYAPFVLELRNIPFEQQRQVLFFAVDRLPRFSFGGLDARGNGQYLAEVALQKYGPNRIEAVMLSESWYREHMPKLKAAFEDRSISLPKDVDLIDDFRAFHMVRGVARLPEKKSKGKDGGQRHGDAGIAAALAVYASKVDAPNMPVVMSSGKCPLRKQVENMV